MTDSVLEVNKPKEEKITSGFWRRLGAFAIDALILGVSGFLLGLVFFDFFVGIGPWGTLVGFSIAIIYFGILNSKIGNGQTLGKRALGIRVEKVSGGFLGVGESFLRFFIFGLFYFLNNAEIPQSLNNMFMGIFVALAVFGLGGSIIYLFVFNKRTRQSLHDLILGSVVVMAGANPKRKIPKIWRGHLVFVTLILLTALSAPFVIKKLIPSQTIETLTPIYQEMNNLPEVRTSGITVNTSFSASIKEGKRTTTFLSALLVLHARPGDYSEMADKAAILIFEKYPEITTKDRLIIQLKFGYDIGIARWSETQIVNLSIVEWVRRLQGKFPKA